jgi:hypothetical protein
MYEEEDYYIGGNGRLYNQPTRGFCTWTSGTSGSISSSGCRLYTLVFSFGYKYIYI